MSLRERLDMAYYVYIITNKKRGTLYIGVTNNILRRIYEHKNELTGGFTKQYKLHKLVYVEEFEQIVEAITREKQLKTGIVNGRLISLNR